MHSTRIIHPSIHANGMKRMENYQQSGDLLRLEVVYGRRVEEKRKTSRGKLLHFH